MTVEQLGKYAGAILAISAVIGGPIAFFQSKAAAEEQKQEQAKSVAQLRIEISMNRVGELNSKEAKEPLTPTEKTERELLLEQVKALQAEAVKK